MGVPWLVLSEHVGNNLSFQHEQTRRSRYRCGREPAVRKRWPLCIAIGDTTVPIGSDTPHDIGAADLVVIHTWISYCRATVISRKPLTITQSTT